jgi:hypothetical protein
VVIRNPETGSEHVGVYKPRSGEETGLRPGIKARTQYHREVAAYEIDRLLPGDGVVPLTTKRIDKDGIGSVQQFAEGAQPLEKVALRLPDPETMADRPSVRRTFLLDEITGNSDRHDFNVLYRLEEPAGRATVADVVAIDNGLTLPTVKPERFAWPVTLNTVRLAELDAESRRAVKALDLEVLARTLKEQAIERKGARGALVRARALQNDPLAIASSSDSANLEEKVDAFFARAEHGDVISRDDHAMIDEILRRTYGKGS